LIIEKLKNLGLFNSDLYVLWLVKILLAFCLLIPLFVSSSLLFPYTAPKAFVFRILVEIAAVFYFYLALKHPEFRPKKTALNLAVLAFLAIYFLASFLGADFYLSFWGNLERMLGFWGLVHFALFFLMLISVFQNQKDWQNLLKISVGVSALVALLAICQHFFGLGNLLTQVSRVYSTIGNPAFLGTYLLFNIFFAGYLFWASRGKEKWLFAASCFLLAVGLFFTGTRGALLGLLVGLVVFLSLLFFLPLFVKNLQAPPFLKAPQQLPPFKRGGEGRFRKWSAICLILIFVLAGLLFSFRHISFVQNNSVLSRLTSISLSGATIQSRLLLWQNAWQAWQAKPILGFGLENFEVAVVPFLSPQMADYEVYSFDRAHNFVFDYGVSGGWLGLLGYLAIFIVSFFYFLKLANQPNQSNTVMLANMAVFDQKKREQYFYFLATFGSLLVAYLVQNFFVFDTFISYLMLFFVLAFVNFIWQERKEKKPVAGKNKIILLKTSQKVYLGAAILLVIFSVYSFNIKAIKAAYLGNQILSLPPESFQQVEPILNKMLALKTFASGEIIYQVTLDYLDKINKVPQSAQNENFYRITSERLIKTIERSSAQGKNYIALAWLDLYFSGQHQERIGEALKLGERAMELSPSRKDAYLILTAAYTLLDEDQKAEEIVKQAEMIDAGLGKKVREYWEKLK
jgi:O-antigen ligase